MMMRSGAGGITTGAVAFSGPIATGGMMSQGTEVVVSDLDVTDVRIVVRRPQ
jgi:hypothetical protein